MIEKHTPECDAQQAAVKAFVAAHPDYCQHCGGEGAWHSHYGSRESPPDGGPCGECVEHGRCPLCAKELTFEEHALCDYGRCAACGWDEWKINQGEQQPQLLPETECYCWVEVL